MQRDMSPLLSVVLLFLACHTAVRAAISSAGPGIARNADGKAFTVNLTPSASGQPLSPEAMLTAQKEARAMAKLYIDSLVARDFAFRQGVDMAAFEQFVADALFNRKILMSP